MKNNILAYIITGIITVIATAGMVRAQAANQLYPSPRSAYSYMKQIPVPESVTVPTVLEMPITDTEVRLGPFALFDTTTQRFVRIIQRITRATVPSRITKGTSVFPELVDNRTDTYADFEAESDETTEMLSYDAGALISSNQLKIDLDSYSKSPSSVSLYTNEGTRTLVAMDTKLTNGSIYFPLTGAQHWEIHISHTQPLRITGISIIPAYTTQNQTAAVRFLGVPGHMYYMYMAPNAGTTEPGVEYADLDSDAGVIVIPPSPTVANPKYVMGDQDADGIADDTDNCQSLANPDQADANQNGKGDACEDFDRDSVMNKNDNCPNASNITQQDADGDGYGDVCDPEESRITERYWWLPWLGIVVGFSVVAFIFATTVKHEKKK